MLQRHQVLLTNWQTEHLKKMAQHNDLSFSELIRILICEGIIRAGTLCFPEYNKKINRKKLDGLTAEGTDTNTEISRRHKILSDVYFEARKVADYIEERTKEKACAAKRS